MNPDFERVPQAGDIQRQTYVWALANATLAGKDVTPLMLERDAAIYCYYTTASRWMDTIELDPLLQLPGGKSLRMTFKNLSNFEHDCIVLLKCFTDQRVFYTRFPKGQAGPGSTFSSGIDIEQDCTLVRLFIATEEHLICRMPGVTLQ